VAGRQLHVRLAQHCLLARRLHACFPLFSPAAASRSGDAGRGCLFLAHRGRGAYAAALWDAGSPLERIHVDDVAGTSGARFMESFESRHSDHSFTAQVVRSWGAAGGGGGVLRPQRAAVFALRPVKASTLLRCAPLMWAPLPPPSLRRDRPRPRPVRRQAEVLGVTRPPLRMDSQVKYGLLSRGDASIFMRFPPPSYREKIWDHCAGFVIVEEAGGKVTDAGGARLDFSRGRWLDLDRGIVAAPPRVHAALLDAVTKVQQQRAGA
jgi:hypothetical protein